MKNNLFKTALFLTVNFILCLTAFTQTIYHSQLVDIKLTGTSNLHDWEMKSAKGTSEVAFVVDAKGIITSLSKLSFSLPVKNLRSKSKAMDKNTYKALNEEANPNISFAGTSATITPKGNNNYIFNCTGNMSIAGTTKKTELVATGKYNPVDKSFTITGIKKMKMTDYNVKPPKALLGSIKTGNDISISYNIKFIS
jgi:hypothetical protein